MDGMTHDHSPDHKKSPVGENTLRNLMHPRVALMTAASLIALGSASAAFAQDAAPAAAPADDATVVVVHGFRASLQSALSAKKKSNLMIRSVAAEDMGKFPDQNISESLQRLPGIQIDRENGQGTTVRIRGLSQNVTTLNGENFLTGLELFQIGEGHIQQQKSLEGIPSQLISGVDVYKSPSANLVEGGLGGIIDLKTRNPRDFKGDWMIGGDLRVNQGSGNGSDSQVEPNLSIVAGKKFGNDFAVMASASYDKSTINTQDMHSENRGVWGYENVLTSSTNDGVADGTADIWSPEYRYTTNRIQERERLGFSLGASWRLSDSFNLRADWFHADLKTLTQEYSMKWSMNNSANVYNEAGLNVASNGVLESGTLSSSSQEGDTFVQNSEATTDNYQLVADWNNGGNLTGKFRLAYSKSNYDSTSGQVDTRYTSYLDADGVSHNPTAPVNSVYSYENGENPTFTPSAANAAAMVDPDSVYFKSHWVFGEESETTNSSATADFKYRPDFAANHDLTLSFGLRATDDVNDYTKLQYLADYSSKGELPASDQGKWTTGYDGSGNLVFVPADTAGATFINWTPYGYYQDANIGLEACGLPGATCAAKSFITPYETAGTAPGRAITQTLNGGVTAIFQNADLMKDPAAWIAALYPSTPFKAYKDPLNSYRVEAKTTTGYLMADVGDPGSGYHINAGVRVVKTDLVVDAGQAPLVPLYTGTYSWNGVVSNADKTHTARSYTDVLPSINAVFDINEHDKIRADAARVVSSQDLPLLGAGNFYNFTRNSNPGPDFGKFVFSGGNGGNPMLDPYRASQYDLAYEHYFGTQGLISGAFFYKSVDSFITNNTVSLCVPDGSTAGCTASAFSAPANGTGGSIKGVELTWNQAFDNGFGFNANFTYSDSESPSFNDYGTNLPIPGVSKTAYNLQGYYEGGGFEARLSYAWRDKSYQGNYGFGAHNLGIWTKAYGQLDGSVGYAISPAFKITLEGVNLTKQSSASYLQFPNLPLRYLSGDQRIMIGLRYNFGG